MTFKTKLFSAAFAAAISAAGMSNAAVLQFEAFSASAGSLGYLQLDETTLDGTGFQFVYGTDLLDLSFTVPGTATELTIADVDLTGATIFDSTSAVPTVVGGAGFTANSPIASVWIAGSSYVSMGLATFSDVTWVTTEVSTGPSAVPLPAGGLLLIGALGGLTAVRRKKNAA